MQKARTRFVLNGDGISIPRLRTIGRFSFGDMLSNDSIRNLLTAYRVAKEAQEARQRLVRLPATSQKQRMVPAK